MYNTSEEAWTCLTGGIILIIFAAVLFVWDIGGPPPDYSELELVTGKIQRVKSERETGILGRGKDPFYPVLTIDTGSEIVRVSSFKKYISRLQRIPKKHAYQVRVDFTSGMSTLFRKIRYGYIYELRDENKVIISYDEIHAIWSRNAKGVRFVPHAILFSGILMCIVALVKYRLDKKKTNSYSNRLFSNK
ncbi:MAG: hypothetical protein GY707_04805 [Desulfobacteraceae bacterium]|nr:hypothetical protein [Desulfobacteraceae bacterium]